ncbi:CLUMA_CG019008, isoform A [Clunio marinus]|uniref:CLUMA_CG019008, isoform A n=1 Tax=Clunio marinus TaxID=568069 RepID=A0A1J1J0V1_9DIPT|nr:CLUMA_CG019008, isoform A [Clunio marinus]
MIQHQDFHKYFHYRHQYSHVLLDACKR